MATIRSPPRLIATPLKSSRRRSPPRRPARVGRRRPPPPTDQRAALSTELEAPRDRRRDVLGRDADVRVRDLAGREQLLHRAPRRVDRDREADALGVARVGADLRVDPDHAAAGVEERAARVAVVDRRVDLDRLGDVVGGGQRRDRALGRRDDADRERVLLAERAADRGDRLADDDAARVAERHGREARDRPDRP